MVKELSGLAPPPSGTDFKTVLKAPSVPQRPVVREPRPDRAELRKYAETARKVARSFGRHLRFRIREETGTLQVEVLEQKGTEEKLIRKIPPDNVINFIEHVQEMFGALIDRQA